MNIYKLNDCDWWVGSTLEACVADCVEQYGDPGVIDEPHELSDEEMDRLTFVDDENGTRTFREQLSIEIAVGGEFPRMFASTEY